MNIISPIDWLVYVLSRSMKQMALRNLEKLGLTGERPRDRIRPWDHQQFIMTAARVYPRTILDRERLYILLECVTAVSSLPGDVVEFGVYKGGSAFLIAEQLREMKSSKMLHLCDTFTGMPETDSKYDLHRKGDFADTSLDSVKSFLACFDNVCFHPGLFADTFSEISDKSFCFAHVDADIYSSVYQCCEFLYPRMVPGGSYCLMIMDSSHVQERRRQLTRSFPRGLRALS